MALARYKIGDVARILGVTPQALRFFEQEGVVMPHKSETGTRYYTIDQLVQLLSFKKYRQAEFSVQDIVYYFTDGSLKRLGERLEAQKQIFEQQSRLMLLRAGAVAFQKSLIDEIRDLPQFRVIQRPAIRVLDIPLTELAKVSSTEREDFMAFENAMPAALICFSRIARQGEIPCYRLAIRESDAIAWRLPMRYTHLMPPTTCVAISVRFDRPGEEENPLDALNDQLRAMGYAPDDDKEVFGVLVASDNIKGRSRLYTKVLVELKA